MGPQAMVDVRACPPIEWRERGSPRVSVAVAPVVCLDLLEEISRMPRVVAPGRLGPSAAAS